MNFLTGFRPVPQILEVPMSHRAPKRTSMTAAASRTGETVTPLCELPALVEPQIVERIPDSQNNLKRGFDEEADYDVRDLARCVDNHATGFAKQQHRIRKLKANLKKEIERNNKLEERIAAMEEVAAAGAGRNSAMENRLALVEIKIQSSPVCAQHKAIWERLKAHGTKLAFLADWFQMQNDAMNEVHSKRFAVLKTKIPDWAPKDDKNPQSYFRPFMPRLRVDRSFTRRRDKWGSCTDCGWEGAASIWGWNKHRTTRKYFNALYVLSEDVACDCGGVAYRFKHYGVPVRDYWALLESFGYRVIQSADDWESDLRGRPVVSSRSARLARQVSRSPLGMRAFSRLAHGHMKDPTPT